MTPSDETLAWQAQQGISDAFAILVDRHKSRVYRTLYQVVGDDQDAQDLAQEVFLKVYRNLVNYRGDAAFSTWLHRLTINLALDWLRARKRRPLQVPLTPPPDGADRPIRELFSGGATPEEALIRQDRQQQVRDAIHNLPADYREVVLFHHMHHLSYQQISDRIGAPIRTIETRLYRARAMLKRSLSDGEGGDDHEVQRSQVKTESVLG